MCELPIESGDPSIFQFFIFLLAMPSLFLHIAITNAIILALYVRLDSFIFSAKFYPIFKD